MLRFLLLTVEHVIGHGSISRENLPRWREIKLTPGSALWAVALSSTNLQVSAQGHVR